MRSSVCQLCKPIFYHSHRFRPFQLSSSALNTCSQALHLSSSRLLPPPPLPRGNWLALFHPGRLSSDVTPSKDILEPSIWSDLKQFLFTSSLLFFRFLIVIIILIIFFTYYSIYFGLLHWDCKLLEGRALVFTALSPRRCTVSGTIGSTQQIFVEWIYLYSTCNQQRWIRFRYFSYKAPKVSHRSVDANRCFRQVSPISSCQSSGLI